MPEKLNGADYQSRISDDSFDVMIIDDTPENLQSLAEILLESNYSVRLASASGTALQSIKEKLPDLILLDIESPEINGYELCIRLKADEDTKNTPIIFLSGNSSPDEKLKVFRAGGVDFILKPVCSEEVLAKVNILFENKILRLKLEQTNFHLSEEIDMVNTANENLEKSRQAVNSMLEKEKQARRALLSILTDQKETFHELKVNEAKYSDLYENSPDMFVSLDAVTLKVIQCNNTIAVKTGYSKEELIGKPVVELFHSRSLNQLEEHLTQFNITGIVTNAELELLKKDGSTIWILVNAAAFRDNDGKIIQNRAVYRDITARKNAEELMREREEQFKAVSEDSFNSICIVTEAGKIIWANDALVTLGGYTMEQMFQADSFLNFISPDSREFVISNFMKFAQGEEYVHQYEFNIIRADGEKRLCEKYMSHYTDRNGRRNLMISMVDITERKNAEKKQMLNSKILAILNRQNEWRQLIKDILVEIKSYSDLEAVSIRLKDKDNPFYLESIGFPTEYLETGKYFCAKFSDAEVTCAESERWFSDFEGEPFQECLCANIISKRIDPSLPFFSIKGSFWTNNTNDFLAAAADNNRQIGTSQIQPKTGNRCIQKGYQSIAVIPLRSGDDIIGLLQLNDARPNRLSLQLIQFLEEIGATIGIAFKRMSNEKVIKESEERFRSVTKSANDAIITTNSSGVIIDWNLGAEHIFGYSSGEMTGAELTKIIPQRYTEQHINGMNRIEQGGAHHVIGKTIELHGIRKNGDEFPLELSLAEWEASEGKYFTGIIRDITERKIVEADLIAAKEKAEHSDKLKTEFLSQMSHEIRTPMHAILSFAGLLKEDLGAAAPPEAGMYFDGIDTAGKRLLRTVELILNVSEMQIGSYQPYITPIRFLREVIDRISDDYIETIKNKKLEFRVSSNVPEAIIHGDKYSIYQIFVNLIDNAVKYTEAGSISLDVISRPKEHETIVTIADTGIGMSEDFLSKLFSPFSQEEQGYSRKFEGNGLGLSLVYKYCEMNGIAISVDSKKGHGTKFTLVFAGKK